MAGQAGENRVRSHGPWVLTASLAIAAGVLWWLIFARVHAVRAEPWPWWVLLSLFVGGRFMRVELRLVGTQPISFVMTDVAFAVTLLLGDLWVIPVGLVTGAVISEIHRPASAVKVAFNLSQELVGTALGVIAFAAIRDDAPVSLRTGMATICGVVVMGAASTVAVIAVTRVASGTWERMSLASIGASLIGSPANGAVALQAVYIGYVSPWLALVPVGFIAVLLVGYRDVRDQRSVTDRTELLYRATSALHEQENIDDGLMSVLSEVRHALRADWAKMILFTPEGAVTCVDRAGAAVQPMTAAPPTEESAARRLGDELNGVTMFVPGSAAADSGPVSVFGPGVVIAAPLTRSNQAAGVLLVDGRDATADRVGQNELGVVGMMAKQIGVALERGYLERSLHQLVELERQLTRQAYYDGITGLANRHYLATDLDRLIESPPTHGTHAVLMVDLDDFKVVNDSLGHVAGDQLLAVIAQRLVGCVGATGLVTRIGGDEFAIVLRNAEDATIDRVAASVISATSQPVHVDGRDVTVGATVGIRTTMGAPDLPTDLLRDADLALYNAKGLGKGRALRYERSMYQTARERLELTAALALAVERDEFFLVFQPIYDMTSNNVAGAEALLRWQHPTRGEVGPGAFLRLTEESGLIVDVGRVVLRKALRQLADWEPHLADGFYLSVNVSPRQLKEPRFADDVLELLEWSGANPRRLVLEITESIFIDDPAQTETVMSKIAKTGVRFGLDDFGTGYSSLSQLQQLPLYLVKIDQSFTAQLGLVREGSVIVRAIIQLAKAMHLAVVAEGVERADQRTMLLQAGCVLGQGWLYGKPMPPDRIIDRIHAPVFAP